MKNFIFLNYISQCFSVNSSAKFALNKRINESTNKVQSLSLHFEN